MARLVGNSARIDTGFGFRLRLACVFGYAVFSLMVLRLWYLQCLHGSFFRDRSENNRTRLIKTVAARGSLFDRDGRILVGSRPSFNIALMLEDVPDKDQTLEELAKILDRPVAELKARLKAGKSRPFEPKIVVADVSRAELARVKSRSYRLPGVIVDVAPMREYPFEDMASHIFGYTREISKKELAEFGDSYERGDLVGKSGIEKVREVNLKGDNGFIRIEVDAGGRRRKELDIHHYEKGSDLHLTLDLDLQLAAEKALEGKRGAVIAVDPTSGDILAMVSAPSYDANIFSGEMDSNSWRGLTGDPEKPLTNRALSSSYPPGSTFKLITAVAGLAEGLVKSDTYVDCPGYFKFGKRRYRCHKRSGHGLVNMRQAITMSCNAFFYNLGVQLGIDKLTEYGKMFGFGETTGISIQGEKTGILPSRRWKKDVIGEQWWPGDTIPVTIGQGYLSVTPIQLAMAMTALASDGTLYEPRLVRKVSNKKTGKVVDLPVRIAGVVPLPAELLGKVRKMSADVVQNKKGTGRRAQVPSVEVGGKTGTAQVARLSRNNKKSKNELLQDHAWFVSYAPVAAPEIVLAIIVENSGHGGVAAAPISKLVMDEYFIKKGVITRQDVIDNPPDLSPAPRSAERPTVRASLAKRFKEQDILSEGGAVE